MPTIIMFYGIIIRMYCAPEEHNLAHFHAYYNDFNTAHVCFDTVEWDNKADIDPEFVYEESVPYNVK